jgi:hypothetical protein
MSFPDEALGLPGREMLDDESVDWSVGGRESADELVGMAEPCIKAPDAQLHIAFSSVLAFSRWYTY